MNFPGELRYTANHEWAASEEGLVKVGVSDYAQKEISDVVFVELPAVGKELQKEKPAAVVESVKAAFDIYAPVSGKVVAVNDSLESNPGLVNQDPYGDGWFFKMEPSNAAELDSLFSSDAYQSKIQTKS